jgi:hypothetical protein
MEGFQRGKRPARSEPARKYWKGRWVCRREASWLGRRLKRLRLAWETSSPV